MEERQDEPNETKTQRRLELGRGDEELFAFLSNNIFIDVYLHFKISNGNLYTSTVELILFLNTFEFYYGLSQYYIKLGFLNWLKMICKNKDDNSKNLNITDLQNFSYWALKNAWIRLLHVI